jgi:hypothetical protein
VVSSVLTDRNKENKLLLLLPMENQEEKREKRASFLRFYKEFLFLVVLGFSIYIFWKGVVRQPSPIEVNVREYERLEAEYKAAMKADTYGGATPEETLELFIDALREGDVDLAGKYFALDTNEQGDSYLTRGKNMEYLELAQKEKKIEELINFLENAKPAGSSMEGYFGFEFFDDNGEFLADLGMRLNTHSGVWKITSL